jgi:N-acetylglutamate synthase-like GNAT family acetyltransferase
MNTRPPTPTQMAQAADTLRRFKRTAELNSQDYGIIEHAEQMIGFAAIAKLATAELLAVGQHDDRHVREHARTNRALARRGDRP